jgi:guanine nucleotide-binding protein G(i) subunit alpha
MDLIHGSGYDAAERQGFKEVILSNAVGGLKTILQAMDTLGIRLRDSDNVIARELVLQHAAEGPTIPPEIVEAMEQLWKDTGVQECFSRASEYQLTDSTNLYVLLEATI